MNLSDAKLQQAQTLTSMAATLIVSLRECDVTNAAVKSAVDLVNRYLLLASDLVKEPEPVKATSPTVILDRPIPLAQTPLDIERHPLIRQAYDLCLAIEKCGASPELTDAVTAAGALMRNINDHIA